ncbi:MAG: aminoglycoside 6-adenylyltransferase [Chloroflexi bacterium]|nr:aminoglycoside 6-adenylyltransferase [Chloroflexota bacterium]
MRNLPAGNLSYPLLETRIHAWVSSRPDIYGACAVGSRARSDPPPDEWSDLDLILFTSALPRLSAGSSWFWQFGEVWLAHLFSEGPHPEWQVIYAGGLKVDFLLVPVTPAAKTRPALQDLLAGFPDRQVLARGVRPLGDLPPIAFTAQPPAPPPSPDEFKTLITQSLFLFYRIEKLARRGELWQAQHQLSCDLRPRLLTLLEWHTRLSNSLPPDTWYHGRRIDAWASPRFLPVLPALFPAYQAVDVHRALLAALDLFTALCGEIARHLHVPIIETTSPILDWIRLAPAAGGS